MIKVLAHQNLLDIALQEYGDARGVITLAIANDRSITDELGSGDDVKITNSEFTTSDILNYYQRKAIQPATAVPFLIHNEPYWWGLAYFLP